MVKKKHQINSSQNNLFNNILLLSRNKLFYTKFDLNDTFENRIHLIFFHLSFIFIKIKHVSESQIYKTFYQDMFDLTFHRIEQNMREIGFGDTTINKNMRFLVKNFYNILLKCEIYTEMSTNDVNKFLLKYFQLNSSSNTNNNKEFIDYFNKYEAFCLDLRSDSVLKGDFKFNFI
jgi:cytochrome b pre-mRNA-processing protein 3